MTARLGPWLKLYGDVVDRKAHYTDRQFRALIEAFVLALRGSPRGTLPPRPALEAKLGVDEVAFLFEQGDIVADGRAVAVVGWDRWQAHVLSTDRVQKSRGNAVETATERDETVTKRAVPNSTSSSTPTTNEDEATPRARTRETTPDPEGDHDALDRYYELTRVRPWGRRPGSWIVEMQERHGVANVVAALEVEHRADPEVQTLLGRVSVRLERQSDRVERAKAKERKAAGPFAPGTVLAEIRAALPDAEPEPEPDVTPESIAAGKAAFEALREQLASTNGSVVRSGQGAPRGLSLTGDRGSVTESPAVPSIPAARSKQGSFAPERSGAATASDRTGRTSDRSAPQSPDGRGA